MLLELKAGPFHMALDVCKTYILFFAATRPSCEVCIAEVCSLIVWGWSLTLTAEQTSPFIVRFTRNHQDKRPYNWLHVPTSNTVICAFVHYRVNNLCKSAQAASKTALHGCWSAPLSNLDSQVSLGRKRLRPGKVIVYVAWPVCFTSHQSTTMSAIQQHAEQHSGASGTVQDALSAARSGSAPTPTNRLTTRFVYTDIPSSRPDSLIIRKCNKCCCIFPHIYQGTANIRSTQCLGDGPIMHDTLCCTTCYMLGNIAWCWAWLQEMWCIHIVQTQLTFMCWVLQNFGCFTFNKII